MALRDLNVRGSSASIKDHRMVTLADALERVQYRFATLHVQSIRSRMDEEIYARGRRLMIWIGDRCDIPVFEDVLLDPQLRHQIDQFPMFDYAEAVEYGETLIRAIEDAGGYGRRNPGLYELGLTDAVNGYDYNPSYLPEIDPRSQQTRYPEGGYEYYQGFREGRNRLHVTAASMKQSRSITLARRSA